MSRFRWIASFILLLSLQLSVLAEAANINGVRLWRAPDHTRVVLDLDAPVQHSLSLVNQPAQLVIELTNVKFKASLADLPLANTPIKSIRVQTTSPNSVKLILDLNARVKPNSFLLKRIGGMHDRLVVDLYDEVLNPALQTDKNLPAPTVAQTTAVNQTLPPSGAQSAQKPQQVTGSKRKIVIVVDPGHGGEDPGAIGPKKIREKDVTLSISKELVALINAQPGYEGKLTRSTDYFIPLKKRRDIARSHKADLFISIHADAFTKASAKGASVFALSRTGATSETARFLAQRENESDLIGGVGSISLDDKDEVLAGVLVDLSMTATLNSSLQIGHQVLSSLGGVAHLHKRRVEQAGFMVLKAPDVPSILVETGFISNPDEAKKLGTLAYRKQIANSIFKGVKLYFAQHPPADVHEAVTATTLPVQNSGAYQPPVTKTPDRIHLVVKGDTLSSISLRYKVKAQRIMEYNKMKNSVVKLGQKLKIPAN
jgi:N-acetylmuramoyl-L-alanine amidase